MTNQSKPPHVNISAGARFLLKQALGTQRGNDVISLLEDGVPAAWSALKKGDFGPLLAIIPAEHLPGLLQAITGMLRGPRQ